MTNIFKKYIYIVYSILLSTLTSCEIVGGIFKAGIWVGILAVVFVVGLIFYIIRKIGGPRT